VRRRWAELSRVERVGLYTRQSLYLLLWGFNAFVLLAATADVDGTAEAIGLFGGGLVVTALAFVGLIEAFRVYPAAVGWPRLAALLVACAVYVGLAMEWDGTVRGAALMTVAASLSLVLSLRPGDMVVATLIVGSALLFGISGGEPLSFLAGLVTAGVFVFTVRASMWLLSIVTELDEAGRAKAQLAVVEERLRFSRDVHDVLGRRLSTIAVQAELAATLAARGDERAADRMLEVRGVAHEALREARELARGYRSTDFTSELEGARSLLRSAGIDVELDVDAMPRAWQEAAGWVVRESVTNVLRHSRASRVEIAFADEALRVRNDGAGNGAPPGDGDGLRGLRERLAPLGATLEAAAEDGHWLVAARLPGAGPLSARREGVT